MACPRPGDKCYEFMCGSSINGVCMGEPDTEKEETCTYKKDNKLVFGKWEKIYTTSCGCGEYRYNVTSWKYCPYCGHKIEMEE